MADHNTTKHFLMDILDSVNPKNVPTRNRAGQIVKNPNEMIPGAIEGLGLTLRDAARGTFTGVAGMPGDISEAVRSLTSKGRNRAGQTVNPNDILGERYFPTSEELQNKLGYEQSVPLKLGQHVVASMIGPNEVVKGIKATKDMPLGLSMIGKESKLWNPMMEKAAARMEAKGATADEIRKSTGLVRGLEGQWRDELSDQFAKLKENPLLKDKEWAKDKNYTTFDALHKAAKNVGNWDSFITKAEKAKYGEKGPDLQKMTSKQIQEYRDFRSNKLDEYNVLENKPVKVKDVLEHPDLMYAYPHLGEIEIKTHPASSQSNGMYYEGGNRISLREDLTPEEAKSTLLHELTHGIQAKEGWNRGANSSEEIKKYFDQKEVLSNQIGTFNKMMDEALNAGDTERYRQLIDQRNVLSERYMAIDPYKMGIEDYMNNAGEAEARLVQRRMNLSPEELLENFPYEQTSKYRYGLDINPDEATIVTRTPKTIDQPSESIDYRGTHKAPGKDEDNFHAPAHELDRLYPKDVYDELGHHYYGSGGNSSKMDREVLNLLREARGNPDHEITIYRAVPSEFKDADINKGDWVTPTFDYANNHGLREFDSHHILEKRVPARHLFTNADSLHEFGYDPFD
jgi:hypothetical protein